MKDQFLTKIILVCFFAALFSCNRQMSKTVKLDKDVSALVELMSGKFSSEAQAQEDSSYYNISLIMYPIWESRTDAGWLYVEQAVAAYKDKPYRQRVYRVSKADNGTYESRVYELPDATKFIHAWDNPKLFEEIGPEQLVIREGCSVYLTKGKGMCYEGSTIDDECKSSLRGATYATSKVKICSGIVESWDQGWDDHDHQVWGATKAGYIFKEIEE